MTQFAQIYCSVADLVADREAPGTDEARLLQAIRDASDFIQKRIGWFLPVTQTLSFRGNGSTKLRLPPSLLSINTITNDDVTLTTDDYILRPSDRFWPYGPYNLIEVVTGSNRLTFWSQEQDGVVINGPWGLYEKTEALNATVQDEGGQSDSQTTLKVSNGGKVSLGMVIKIQSEQEAIVGWEAPTSNVTAINMASGLDSSETVVTLDNVALVQIGEIIRLEFEQCKIVDIRASSHQASLIRGWNGTRIVSHADNTQVDVYRTVTVERGVNGTTAASHALSTALSRQCVPFDILELTKEIATLGVNKARSGYQGRTGNDQTGVIFYNDKYPQYDIETVAKGYYISRAD